MGFQAFEEHTIIDTYDKNECIIISLSIDSLQASMTVSIKDIETNFSAESHALFNQRMTPKIEAPQNF